MQHSSLGSGLQWLRTWMQCPGVARKCVRIDWWCLHEQSKDWGKQNISCVFVSCITSGSEGKKIVSSLKVYFGKVSQCKGPVPSYNKKPHGSRVDSG